MIKHPSSLIGLLLASIIATPAFTHESDPNIVRELIRANDLDNAKRLLIECANNQDHECQFILAELIERGELFQTDLASAKALYELAYAGGYIEAAPHILRLTKELSPPRPASPASPSEVRGTPDWSVANTVADASGRSGRSRLPDAIINNPFAVPEDVPAWASYTDCAPAKFRYEEGRPIASVDCGINVEIAALGLDRGWMFFGIRIENDQPSPYAASLSKLTAEQNEHPIHILSAEEFSRHINRRSTGRKMLGFLAHVVDAIGTGMSAGRSDVIGTYSGSARDGRMYSGSVIGTVTDHEAKARAQGEVSERYDQLKSAGARQDRKFATISKAYFRDSTVRPGDEVMYIFATQLTNPLAPVVIHVDIDGTMARLELRPPQ